MLYLVKSNEMFIKVCVIILTAVFFVLGCIPMPFKIPFAFSDISTVNACGEFSSAHAPQYPFPHRAKYGQGILPNNYSRDEMNKDMLRMYNQWRELYITSEGCEPGEIRVLGGGGYKLGTCSEAIGYGMLISVYMATPTNSAHSDFDGLFRFYKRHLIPGYGLMEWEVNKYGNGVNPWAAPDGDMDVAFALLMAHKQWGSKGSIDYLSEAKTLINNIMEHAVNKPQYTIARTQLVNVLSWSNTMSSYQMPAFYNLFYYATGDKQWLQCIKAAYDLYDYFSRANSTGLLPFRFRHDYSPVSYSSSGAPNDYHFGFDSCRVPWRITLDYLWNGTSNSHLALELPNQQVNWFVNWIKQNKSGDYSQTPASFNLDGTQRSTFSSPRNMVAMMAPAAMVKASNQEILNELYDYLRSIELTHDWPGDYYQDTLLVLGMLTLTGNMPNFYHVEAYPDSKIPPADISDTTPPTKPTNISVEEIKHNMIKLSWSPSTDESGKVRYIVYTNGNIHYATSQSGAKIVAYLNHLTPGKRYDITVVAIDEAGNRAVSDIITVNTDADSKPPSKPTNLIAKARTPYSITLRWGASSDNDGLNVSYDVFMNNTKLNSRPVYFNDDFVVLNLLPETSYTFKVIARDTSGNTSESDPLTVSTTSIIHSLNSTISSAQTLYNSANEGNSETDYLIGSKAIYNSVIQAAIEVRDSANVRTKTEIDAAEAALKAATRVFYNSQVVKQPLVSKIAHARALINNSVKEGTVEGQPYGTGSHVALNAAILRAQLICDQPSVTSSEINSAVANLNNSMNEFLSSKVVLNRTALRRSISVAQEIYNEAEEGSSEGQYPEGSKARLQKSITKAIAADISVGTKTQMDIDDAVRDLNNAITSFQLSRIGISVSSIVFGPEQDGGIGKTRTINIVGGNYVNLAGKYLVLQFTEGAGENAKISIAVIPAVSATTVSYANQGTKIDVWLVSDMPDFIGEDMSSIILVRASTTN